MASAKDVFPLLPPKDLSSVLIRIFQHLNLDQDIHAYRLVSKGWRDFIDSHILSSQTLRKRFLQHPLGVPPEQRRPLIRAKLLDCPPSVTSTIFEKGRYLLVRRHPQLLLFTKTEAGLKPVGSIQLRGLSSSRNQGVNGIATCQDYVFQLYSASVIPDFFCEAPVRLQSFKKQEETWITYEHPARHLWEGEGLEILGMRQVSESKALLLVLIHTEGLLQAIDLSDGTIKLATKSILTLRDYGYNRKSIGFGSGSKIFDMDSFGLIIRGNEDCLQHFSFEIEDQSNAEPTWQTVVPRPYWALKSIWKARKVTVFQYWGRDIVIVDNASGEIKYQVNSRHLGSPGFDNFRVVPSDDFIFLSMRKLPASLNLEVFNISENRVMSFPVTVPEVPLDDQCLMKVFMTVKQSKATALYTLRIDREIPGNLPLVLWSGVAWLDARQPGRMIVLSHPAESSYFIACVPCEHGFFAINRTVCHSTFNPNAQEAIESWKY